MYGKKEFGKELKLNLEKGLRSAELGHWVYGVYIRNISEIDKELQEIMLFLNTMEDGPEFELSYEELDKIADELIAGKDVKL